MSLIVSLLDIRYDAHYEARRVCCVLCVQSKETHVVAPAVQIEMWKDPGIQNFFMGTGG